MAIQTSGPIYFSDLQTEFGGTTPIYIGDYYRGGSLVNNFNTSNNTIAASGSLYVDGFYRASKRRQLSVTISGTQGTYNMTPAVNGNYVAGVTDFFLTVNAGIQVYGNDVNTAAVQVYNFNAGDTVQIINYGTIYGAGGGIGSMQQNGGVNTTWAVGNGPNCINTGYTFTGSDGNGYGNYSSTIYYWGPGMGGNWPVYDSYSGGTGPGNGGTGGNGGPALYLGSNIQLVINNKSSGKIVGGGGGCGGMAGNNRGGGQGGQGGYCLIYAGSHPDVVAYNEYGGILAGGGGGAGGWGNRYEGEGHGGYYGTTGNGFFWTGAGASFGAGGPLSYNNGTTLINSSSGTYIISPAA
jgi:hypothetical protein